jgi:tRNA threonylcarbamoyl adenosine modification protein YeaZ
VLVLVIDASSAAVTAGVAGIRDGADGPIVQVLGERVVVDGRAHAELLAISAKGALADAGASMGDVGAVIGGIGPGPYTGLRVGIVSAASFADALGIAAYAVCSLDAIGLQAGFAGDLLVAADARRREVYWARYVAGARIGAPDVHRPAELAALLESTGRRPTAMTGAGARQYAEFLGLPLLDVDYPPVGALAQLGAGRALAGAASEILEPMYLRRPDAVPPGVAKSALASLKTGEQP